MQKLILAFLLMLLCTPAIAADRYTVGSGATVEIDMHGVCQKVTNSGPSRMVPAKTAAEWLSFRTSPGSGISLDACEVSCGGVSIGGYCWYAGATAQSCTQACSGRGGVNMDGTRNYTGTGGTSENCANVARSLGLSETDFVAENNSCNSGFQDMGCSQVTSHGMQYMVRCTNGVTTSGTSKAGMRRVCACNN